MSLLGVGFSPGACKSRDSLSPTYGLATVHNYLGVGPFLDCFDLPAYFLYSSHSFAFQKLRLEMLGNSAVVVAKESQKPHNPVDILKSIDFVLFFSGVLIL